MIDILIRTYTGDLNWLNYSLKSIHKYVTGYRRIVVLAEKECIKLMNLTRETAVEIEGLPEDDYKGAMIDKLNTALYTDADHILWIDSDCVFKAPLDVNSFIVDGRPYLLKQLFDERPDSKAAWKHIVDDFFGVDAPFDFLCSYPMLYKRSTFTRFNETYPHWEEWARARSYRNFIEFSILGHFVETTHPEEYNIIDIGKEPIPCCYNKMKQFWSWGGFTDEVWAELREYGLCQ